LHFAPHFGGVDLFNEPDKALREFVRVTRENGIVSCGEEGFSKSYKGEVKRRIPAKLNPGFLKLMPGVPEALHERKIHEVYGGLGYLIVARKN
jgi:ubiquinone/menaquinone biosynthesis C-methylase UbiE